MANKINIKKSYDYEEHGGTPILGVNGIVIKCHGSSKSKAIAQIYTYKLECKLYWSRSEMAGFNSVQIQNRVNLIDQIDIV